MFIGKVIIICGIVFLWLSRVRKISKAQVFLLLFGVWSLAYLYSPYWYTFSTFGFPNLKYVGFLSLVSFGVYWGFLSASNVRLPKFQIHAVPLFALGTLLYFVIYRQLNLDIPWRGDDGYHVSVLLQLKAYLIYCWYHVEGSLFLNPVFWIFILVLLFVVYNLFRFRGRSLHQPLVFCGILLLIIFPPIFLFFDQAFTDQRNIFLISDVLRYPYIHKWVSFFFLIPNFYDIDQYRIVPFLSLIGIASFLYNDFYKKLHSKLLAFLFSLAFSTVPLLLYYSSILYLEMPIVFLMIVCVWNIEILIKEDFDILRQHYIWYVVLLMSFLKETTIIFLLSIVFLRGCYQVYVVYKIRKIWRSLVFSELRLVFTVLCPVIVYIFFRRTFAPYIDSSPKFYLDKIFSFSNYVYVLQSLITQAGLLPIIGTLGLIYLSKKDIFTTRVIVIIFVSILFFYLGYLYRGYTLTVGYSRWNLFLLPMILFWAAVSVNYIVKRKNIYGILLLLVIFAFNLRLFPFKSDGTRLPNWGAPRMDSGEYSYPYAETIRFLSTEKSVKTLLILGSYSQYLGLRFYLEKYDFHPTIREYYFGLNRFDQTTERQKLDQFFNALPFSADAILYHSVNNIDLNMNDVYGEKYIIITKVQNSLHSIFIFFDKNRTLLKYI